ncbi:MAG: hypothetical protein M3Q93_05720 [Gemmatimonadota bacterium]|nr:hypothetical protein [Gemmatimonadota bacterium]
MYLVELRPGKEELFRTGDDLAAAIRSGDVDMHSRIYHRATSKWISVTLHPQYKAIVAEQPASPQVPPLERMAWTFFNDSADTLAGANDTAAPEGKGDGDGDPTWRRPLALSVTGGMLILGLQLAASGPRPPWAARDLQATSAAAQHPASTGAARAAGATLSYASAGDRWLGEESAVTMDDADDAPAEPVRSKTSATILPARPRLGAKALLADVLPAKPVPAEKPAAAPAPASTPTVSSMLQRWTAAHDSARARLASGMRVARLNQLFAIGRLSPAGGVTETRMSLAVASNFVRVYRQQQRAIDYDYQDSFVAASKQQGWAPERVRDWYAKPAQQETVSLAALTTSLIEQMDSLLGMLDAQAGTYTLTKNTIKFEEPGAALAYSALRTRIIATVDSAKAQGGLEHTGPMSFLLQAIGTTRLPLAS